MTLKHTAMIAVTTFIIGSIAGGILTHKTNPASKDPEIKQDVTPPKHEVIKQPETDQEYKTAFNSPIEITRKLTGDLYAIAATDGYKSTHVQDRVIIPVTTPRFMIQADLYGGMVNKSAFYIYGASVDYFYNSRVFLGGGFAGSSYGVMIHGSAGFAFY